MAKAEQARQDVRQLHPAQPPQDAQQKVVFQSEPQAVVQLVFVQLVPQSADLSATAVESVLAQALSVPEQPAQQVLQSARPRQASQPEAQQAPSERQRAQQTVQPPRAQLARQVKPVSGLQGPLARQARQPVPQVSLRQAQPLATPEHPQAASARPWQRLP